MKQATHQLSFKTTGRGLVNINNEIIQWVNQQSFKNGLLTIFIRHTSASLVIQENADPDVLFDLSSFLDRLVPDGDSSFLHSAEGPDDMPAHIRSALTQTQLSIPLIDGRLALGTWQDVYLFEHRTHPHHRTIALHLLGE